MTTSFAKRRFGRKTLSVETFVNQNLRHLTTFYVQASLKNDPMKIFVGKKFRQLAQILLLLPMQLLPTRYVLFEIKHPSLWSFMFIYFKYFTNFLKDTTTTLPSLSVYLTGIARITQNREKCLIFIVFPQAWTKIRVNEKKKEKNSDNNNMRMNKSKANTLNIYAYVYVHTPIDMQIYINTDTPIHMNT